MRLLEKCILSLTNLLKGACDLLELLFRYNIFLDEVVVKPISSVQKLVINDISSGMEKYDNDLSFHLSFKFFSNMFINLHNHLLRKFQKEQRRAPEVPGHFVGCLLYLILQDMIALRPFEGP